MAAKTPRRTRTSPSPAPSWWCMRLMIIPKPFSQTLEKLNADLAIASASSGCIKVMVKPNPNCKP